MTTTTPAPSFDVTAALQETGRLVIGASAGTGKTYTLAALACRHVAERGVPVGELLVVTFTRAAAAELRDRIRSRLVDAARVLSGAAPLRADDPVLVHLATGSESELRERRRRLELAVADFDTATITTIHGFCTQVLAAQGSTGPFDPSAVLVQDPTEVVDSTVADVLVEAALAQLDHSGADGPPTLPKANRLAKLAQLVLANPGIGIMASGDRAEDELMATLLERVVQRVSEQLRRAGAVTFDDQLTRVAELLEHDAGLRRSLSDQFAVVMIDESQDTDPVQWRALTTAFQGSSSLLVVVGDPKQAIYSFRGGDVYNYLEAVELADDRRSLDTNHRSDGSVVTAMNLMSAGASLGHERIVYEPVRSPEELAGRSLVLDGRPVPGLWVRSVTDPEQPRNKNGTFSAERARRTIREDLANQVAVLLDGAGVVRASDGADGAPVPLRPDDVAVLVKARSDAAPIQRALLARGIASVVIGAGSVTDSLAASHWRWLIEGLQRPTDARLARAVGLSWFFDLDAATIAATAADDPTGAGAETLTSIQRTLVAWAEVLRRQGVAAMVERVWRESDLRERVLARATGERDLTDLDHLAELLHTATGGRPVGPEALRERFDALDDPEDEAVEDPDAVRRRVDSDTSAVRIMTIHVSKGLEFPVVCCPTLWSAGSLDVTSRTFHDDAGDRFVDVSDPPDETVKCRAQEEADGELRRLTYVALTRALHTTLVWWAPVGACERSGLAHLLFGSSSDAAADVPPVETDAVEVIETRVAERGAVDVVRVDLVDPEPGVVEVSRSFAGGPGVTGDLEVARLGRELDRTAGRWSFTAIAARAAHVEPPTGRPAGLGTVTDPDDPTLGDSSDDDERTSPPPVLFDGLGAGAAFGTLVHAALEEVDFTADLEAQLTSVLDVPWSSVEPDKVPQLVKAIAASVRTPLGDALGGGSLEDLARSDRLDELDFELPLGDRRGSGARTVSAASIGTVLARHLPSGDEMSPWAQRLAGGLIDVEVGGHLTGSIDLVMRVPTDEGHRYSVVDYKTNRLGIWGEPDSVANYHPDLLPAAMEAHDYPLQAVLYSVALHRYLRWRLPGYRPEVHLGPVGYLFVRGMVGPRTPLPDGRPHGVFAWTVPPAAVVELSDLLHGRGPEVSG
ncbi:UvrD-helicase domain-containing protein [Dermatobacter hominis]|uniref:UvrD-helicase domain-containing protein n=1 Tax=Dermatobacter hominis TaxID=2884263 RepID=UPI001D113A99|nr:UvrD-helicase domain-containing protein [Dermatobacter hominis]UDY34764.1 UvrD-helicase domain-containing protein [Dermatobacter hominis]